MAAVISAPLAISCWGHADAQNLNQGTGGPGIVKGGQFVDAPQAIAFLWERRRDYQTNLDEKARISAAVRYLGKASSGKASEVLASLLDFRYDRFENLPLAGRFPRYSQYPAIGAMKEIGNSSVPFIVDELSRRSESPEFLFCALTTLSLIRPKDKNPSFILKVYSQEYDSRAKRLTVLSNESLHKEVSREAAIPGKGEPSIGGLDSTTRLQKVFELSILLQDGQRTKPGDLIRELARLNATECSSNIAEYLDYGENARGPEGGNAKYSSYPAVGALVSLGAPAITEVAQSLAREGRSKTFRENGLTVIVDVTGSGPAAAKVLSEQAAKCRMQSDRLRDLAKQLNVP